MERVLMRRLLATVVLAGALASCGGSGSDADPTPSSSSSPSSVTAADFRASVTELWQPLKFADPTKVGAAALAAKFAGFAAAVEAQPVPAGEISAQAAIASAARSAADHIRAASEDPVGYGSAVGAAQGTIGGLISELPK